MNKELILEIIAIILTIIIIGYLIGFDSFAQLFQEL